jgi:hypothetical protein
MDMLSHRMGQIVGRKLWLVAIVILVAGSPAWAVGEDEPAIVLWSSPAHAELAAETPIVGVVAYHLNGVEKVEFLVDGKVVATAKDETKSPVTGEIEFVGKLEGLALKPGQDIKLTARVHPNTGKGKITDVPARLFHVADPASVKQLHVHLADGNDETGDGSAGKPVRTVAKALTLAGGGDQVLLHDGAHELMLKKDHKFDRFVTIRPAPDAKARIVKTGRSHCGMLKFENIWFDWSKNDSHMVFGGNTTPHYWFRNCRFIGEKGRFNNYTRALKFWGKATDVTVEGCTFQYLDIAVVASKDAIIRGNMMKDLTADGVICRHRNLITGNTITGLKAPNMYVTSGAKQPFDFSEAGKLMVHHAETRNNEHAYDVDLGGLAHASKATAADVVVAMNKAFKAQKPDKQFGLVAEAVDGAVKITCRRTNHQQHLYFTGPANRVLQYAPDSKENELVGSGQHADVFHCFGGAIGDIIIRNNRAYDNSAQQWLAQNTVMRNVAFYNNLLDAYSETAWSVMFRGQYENFVIEHNTIWNATSSIILRKEVFQHGKNRSFVIRNNIFGTGTGLGGLKDAKQFYTDYNIYDYYGSAAKNRGPHSKVTNPEKKRPTESGLFANVKTRLNKSGRIDYYAEEGDFSPGPDSPAVDAGSNASGIDYDLNWNPRDEKPDIGAFEYQKGK